MDIFGIENSMKEGKLRTKLFFCDSYASSQKGAIESNHRLIRYSLPKKTDFQVLDSNMVKNIQLNIANYSRKDLGNTAPIDYFIARFGEEIANKLGLKKIDPTQVDLSPFVLLKDK